MSIRIQSGKRSTATNLQTKLQSVPFKIHADCDAKVKKYFETYVKEKENHLTASFRGYPLKGKVIDVPDGYKGLVLHESMKPMTEKEDRNFYVIHTFDKLTMWNWDKVPSKNDAMIQALDWIDIAEALHSPIVDE
ncbi:PREDICTED: uncharacterized protein LOC108566067 [Nicrophorus vespilloides]|uniref:Uncharacterized protein LOC108566067 n=1 Tax=Nicrophorus vespilloides TaxID=110193 RepID=A0ABM1N361_NICVS|nr:PREDICTED: uncharacterized protein LOC108566067 [Nicrophorus vespilloides]